jgi:hypothetical protein
MRNMKKVLAVLSVAAVMAPAVAAAAQPNDSSASVPAATTGTAYGAPAFYGPPPYAYGPYYGPGYWGGPWGRGAGSGRMRVNFDFDGFANGWMPWNWW